MSTYPISRGLRRTRLVAWHGTRVEWLAALAFLAIALHLLVDALTRGRPAPITVLELLAGLVLAPALFAFFLRAGRLWRVVISGLAGLVAFVLGVEAHAAGAVMAGRRASDFTGIAMALAGLVLVGVALRLSVAGLRRWLQTLLVFAVVVVFGQLVLVPAINVSVVTHAPREAMPTASTLALPGARDVTLSASDGVRLSGWYVPGRNGAAVILLHGSHGDRTSTEDYLRFLSRAGYGVLAFDARGHGQSGGHTNALGWQADRDVAGAVAFLRRQHDVEPSRIGMLGLSMGAEVALRAAANGVPLRAIVADGAGAATTGDNRLVSHGDFSSLYYAVNWLTMRQAELLSTYDEPAPLKSIVGRIEAPTLLIATNWQQEITIDRKYRALIGRNAQLWHVLDAGHTQTLRVHPARYKARVGAFFASALRVPAR
jgi:uncharacterized protein